MEKKVKIHLTNEEVVRKFKSSFDLVNYAIALAENMIHTGRDARVKSDIQNRAMLILEEIHVGADKLDEINADIKIKSTEVDLDGVFSKQKVFEEHGEKRKYRSSDVFTEEE